MRGKQSLRGKEKMRHRPEYDSDTMSISGLSRYTGFAGKRSRSFPISSADTLCNLAKERPAETTASGVNVNLCIDDQQVNHETGQPVKQTCRATVCVVEADKNSYDGVTGEKVRIDDAGHPHATATDGSTVAHDDLGMLSPARAKDDLGARDSGNSSEGPFRDNECSVIPGPRVQVTRSSLGLSPAEENEYKRQWLKRTFTLYQHYYPEGGWGWVILTCNLFVQMLTYGLQLSFGIILQVICQRFDVENVAFAGTFTLHVMVDMGPPRCAIFLFVS
ncbi:unnamed protein product [Darwinula stevensoni]|uniref:Uncharacterized protein n=1 Tax=Darwinula stevensoni TaxID=69355 RepID=A0A7R8X4C2_9CRUS|nr:unnamed protein product [Darwinula stevensoni]CAG0885882.1 unnamed protein product [Darwinula stevensoni]